MNPLMAMMQGGGAPQAGGASQQGGINPIQMELMSALMNPQVDAVLLQLLEQLMGNQQQPQIQGGFSEGPGPNPDPNLDTQQYMGLKY